MRIARFHVKFASSRSWIGNSIPILKLLDVKPIGIRSSSNEVKRAFAQEVLLFCLSSRLRNFLIKHSMSVRSRKLAAYNRFTHKKIEPSIMDCMVLFRRFYFSLKKHTPFLLLISENKLKDCLHSMFVEKSNFP